MKNKIQPVIFSVILAIFLMLFSNPAAAYDKKSVVERFTNCSCGPCASINNAWYNATTASLINSGSISHIIYNVDWPSPTDPMHLLNIVDNSNRTSYYGVNAVPWIEVNGSVVGTGSSAPLTTAVTNGNAEFAPFNIVLTPEVFSNNVINVHVNITRDPTDITTFENTKLRIALTEKTVAFGSPPGNNGESVFFSVCRKMLPDGNGFEFTVPAPGESIDLDFLYNPTNEFLQSVNFDSIRVAAFIQSDDTKEVYQSAMADLQPSDNVNAAFEVEENLGAAPFVVDFIDLSTATSTSSIVSWEWDFNNDGTIDSNDPLPTWTFYDEQAYTVSLTVSDGVNQHTRTIENFITVLGSTSSILVVNGIHYSTYVAEMDDFYNNSACIGNHQVDVWDLFGDQGFNYSANPNIQQINLLNRTIPNSILNLYQKVIWIGNSYSGDLAFYDPAQVLNYIGQGGNFLLASRQGADFFSTELLNYCGITSMTGLMDVTELIALDNNLVNMPALAGHSRVQFATLDAGSEAIAILDDNTTTNWIAGFRIQKDNEGGFVYIAGRPYRYDNTASFQNYDYIIDNWLNFNPVPVELTSFAASVHEGEVVLNWSTATETNNHGFEIQRNLNGEFLSVGFVDGYGTTTEKQNYTFTDKNLEVGSYTYRLKQVDFDGTFEYSESVEIDVLAPNVFSLQQNFPNPFNPGTRISYSIPASDFVTLKVYNALGSEVTTLVNEFQQSNNYSVIFNASNLSSGIYFYVLQAGTYSDSKKMILIK